MRVLDLAKLPIPPKAPNGNHSVSKGLVGVYKQENGLTVVGCYRHGAMLAVAPTKDGGMIFRCPTCNEGAYRSPTLKRRIKNVLDRQQP